jgi:hypothetical protein
MPLEQAQEYFSGQSHRKWLLKLAGSQRGGEPVGVCNQLCAPFNARNVRRKRLADFCHPKLTG